MCVGSCCLSICLHNIVLYIYPSTTTHSLCRTFCKNCIVGQNEWLLHFEIVSFVYNLIVKYQFHFQHIREEREYKERI